MNLGSRIYIAGHRGMVGSAIIKVLRQKGFTQLITRASNDLDCRNQLAVNNFFESEKPEYVFLAAARVGGILANNTYRADFIYENLMIEANIIHAAYQNKVTKLLFLGSSCIYPKLAPQPLKEDYLLTGALEYSNEPYALAKIAGVKMCEAYNSQYNCNFISVMPTNLYGTGDNYDLNNSHVLPALIKKIHLAKITNKNEVVVWGTGKPRREFLHADDLADACVFLMLNYNESQPINIGTGIDLTVYELAETIKKIIGYSGKLIFDITKPDGTPRKLLDVTRVHNLGWQHQINLEEGIKMAYSDFMKNESNSTASINNV